MSQITKLENLFTRNRSASFTTRQVAAMLKMPRDSVHKRVYDLRSEGYKIVNGTKTIKGKTVNTYRLAV